ncbi:hypothetical protein Ae717Ps2_6784c [Pseudonocardia sp. Ae717_Ps2]|nr:hypothetical protein Ae717Ps2_6784c [Pseudonocardia sp. Ae717_Ps2]
MNRGYAVRSIDATPETPEDHLVGRDHHSRTAARSGVSAVDQRLPESRRQVSGVFRSHPLCGRTYAEWGRSRWEIQRAWRTRHAYRRR